MSDEVSISSSKPNFRNIKALFETSADPTSPVRPKYSFSSPFSHVRNQSDTGDLVLKCEDPAPKSPQRTFVSTFERPKFSPAEFSKKPVEYEWNKNTTEIASKQDPIVNETAQPKISPALISEKPKEYELNNNNNNITGMPSKQTLIANGTTKPKISPAQVSEKYEWNNDTTDMTPKQVLMDNETAQSKVSPAELSVNPKANEWKQTTENNNNTTEMASKQLFIDNETALIEKRKQNLVVLIEEQEKLGTFNPGDDQIKVVVATKPEMSRNVDLSNNNEDMKNANATSNDQLTELPKRENVKKTVRFVDQATRIELIKADVNKVKSEQSSTDAERIREMQALIDKLYAELTECNARAAAAQLRNDELIVENALMKIKVESMNEQL